MRLTIVASSRNGAVINTITTPKAIMHMHAAYNCRLLAPYCAQSIRETIVASSRGAVFMITIFTPKAIILVHAA